MYWELNTKRNKCWDWNEVVVIPFPMTFGISPQQFKLLSSRIAECGSHLRSLTLQFFHYQNSRIMVKSILLWLYLVRVDFVNLDPNILYCYHQDYTGMIVSCSYRNCCPTSTQINRLRGWVIGRRTKSKLTVEFLPQHFKLPSSSIAQVWW